MTAKWCFKCGYQVVRELPEGERAPRNAAIHWRACERKRDWPAWMLAPKKPGPVAEPVTMPTSQSFQMCECGGFAADVEKTRAWAAHLRGAPHKRVMAQREAAVSA